MLGPPKPRRRDEPVTVSLEDLVPADHFNRHLEARLDQRKLHPRLVTGDTTYGTVENIVAVKEASGNLSQIMEILRGRPANFRVISGDDSLTLAMTSIFVRSAATRKSVGVWKLAATVCPTSTLRETTTPSTGETM